MIKLTGYFLVISGGITLYQDIVPTWAGVLMIVIGIIMTGLWHNGDGGWFDGGWFGGDGDGGGDGGD